MSRGHQQLSLKFFSTAPSPKLSPREKRESIYPYYAGYSLAFTEWALHYMEARPGQSLLDPWNGTGTSTYAAASMGLRATGVDLNPVLSIVAKARCADHEDRVLIEKWMAKYGWPSTATAIDAATCFYRFCASQPEFVSGSPVEALLIIGMFPAVRESFSAYKTKNPVWYSRPLKDEVLSGTYNSALLLQSSIIDILKRHSNFPNVNKNLVTVINDDIHTVMLARSGYDLVVTSPPYLTRLDYVKATMPELTFLDVIDLALPDSYLRQRMLGTPLTKAVAVSDLEVLPKDVRQLLSQISSHDSKASSTYYFRFFAKYFIDLRKALGQISNALSTGGRLCIVVQPSYYKDIFVDLPAHVASLASGVGLGLDESLEFDTSHSMVSLNSKAQTAARQPVTESALFFSKA